MAIFDKITQVSSKNFKKHTGEIGLEIETETIEPYVAPEFYFWNVHQDGSLRNFGQEYVLKAPVQYKDEFPKALDEWNVKTKKIPFIKDSFSTSVHVHLNFLTESFKTLGNFLTIYTLLENVLIRYSGPDRLSNLFCLPICDAEETYKNMENLFKGVAGKNYKSLIFNENSVKYAACNLAALGSYGSIEIRSFRGETDIEKIQKWVDILYDIYKFSRQKDMNPKVFMLEYKNSKNKIMDLVFSKNNRKELTIKDEEKLIDRNAWYAASVAYSLKDLNGVFHEWDTIDEEEKKPDVKFKPKDLEAMSMKVFGRSFADLTDIDKQHILFVMQKTKTYSYTPIFNIAEHAVERPRAAPRGARARNENAIGGLDDPGGNNVAEQGVVIQVPDGIQIRDV